MQQTGRRRPTAEVDGAAAVGRTVAVEPTFAVLQGVREQAVAGPQHAHTRLPRDEVQQCLRGIAAAVQQHQVDGGAGEPALQRRQPLREFAFDACRGAAVPPAARRQAAALALHSGEFGQRGGAGNCRAAAEQAAGQALLAPERGGDRVEQQRGDGVAPACQFAVQAIVQVEPVDAGGAEHDVAHERTEGIGGAGGGLDPAGSRWPDPGRCGAVDSTCSCAAPMVAPSLPLRSADLRRNVR